MIAAAPCGKTSKLLQLRVQANVECGYDCYETLVAAVMKTLVSAPIYRVFDAKDFLFEG